MENSLLDLIFKEETPKDEDTIKAFIPIKDTGYIEYETVNIPGKPPVIIEYDVPPKPKLQHEIEMWDIINEFEVAACSPKNKGLYSGFKGIDEGFDGGIKPGFIVIGGDSNLG